MRHFLSNAPWRDRAIPHLRDRRNREEGHRVGQWWLTFSERENVEYAGSIDTLVYPFKTTKTRTSRAIESKLTGLTDTALNFPAPITVWLGYLSPKAQSASTRGWHRDGTIVHLLWSHQLLVGRPPLAPPLPLSCRLSYRTVGQAAAPSKARNHIKRRVQPCTRRVRCKTVHGQSKVRH